MPNSNDTCHLEGVKDISLRSKRLEVVDERENGRARGRYARGEEAFSPLACLLLSRAFFSCAHYIQAPATQATKTLIINSSSALLIVERLLNKLNKSKGAGLDKISSRLIRDCADLISPYISINYFQLSDEWKLTKVTPIFKQGDRSDMNNYRLISVFSAVAKFFERIVYNQISTYLSKSNILSKHQSGFRSLHSTVTALLEATDN